MGQRHFCLYRRKSAAAPAMSLFCPAIEFDIGFVLHNTDVNFTHLSERANNKLDEVKLNKDYESMYYYKIHWGASINTRR
jgi:hypothetical protein